MKILITGGSGRIGKPVVEYLAGQQKYELWFLQRNNSHSTGYNTIQLDLINESQPIPKQIAAIKFDAIIHMAGITHMKDTKELGEKNIAINKNFLKFLRVANGDSPLIFFSSVDVYGITNQNFPLDIKSKCTPSSYYGRSKLFSEELFTKNLSKVYNLRIAPMIANEGEKDYLKRVYLPGTRIKFQSPYARENSFSDIKSICQAINSCLEGSTESTINVTDGKIYTENDFLKGSDFSLKIPKFFLNLVFNTLRRIDTPFSYRIEHKFHKLFKTNTYA